MKKRILPIVIIIAGLLVAVLLAGFLFLGAIVKAGVERGGPFITKVPVTLSGANISVVNGSGQLKGFSMGNPEGFKAPQSVSVGSVSVKLEPGSLLSDKMIVRSVVVEAPEITYEAAFGGSNIGKILENIQAVASQGKSNPDQPGSKKKLQVDEFVITGAKLNITASVIGGNAASLTLPDIRLASLGQGPDGITAAELSARAFKEVVEAAAKAVTANAVRLGGSVADTAKEVGADAKDRLKKASSGISDLIKGKKE
jgi:hypothetical protein